MNAGSIISMRGFYRGRSRFSFCENKDLHTFIEAKHFNPFPELLFNFSGLVLEMMKEVIDRNGSELHPKHISPALILSGNGNDHSKKIQQSLMGRFNVNIIFGLFYNSTQMQSKNVCTIGSRNI